MKARDLHSALKTETIASTSVHTPFILVKLQWGKEDFGYSLHAAPNTFTSAGFQITDFLAYLGFKRQRCDFAPGGEGFCLAVPEGFDFQKFSQSFNEAFRKIERAERFLEVCGFSLDQPEGWGYFYGKPAQGRSHRHGSYTAGDGHTAPKTDTLKTSEDDYFQYSLTWMEGREKGWTFHYRPKHPPISDEMWSVVQFFELRNFPECPSFDFEECFWRFIPFRSHGDSPFDSNVEWVHRWFDAHAQNLSLGIEELLETQSLMKPFGMLFLPTVGGPQLQARASVSGSSRGFFDKKPSLAKKHEYDVAISFAGTERSLAQTLAKIVQEAGFNVYYDNFYPEQLWGKDLVVFFDEIYRKSSRYCVIFVSQEYCSRMWTNHERKSAQARALEEKGKEYILPIKVDDAELAGMQPTIGYLDIVIGIVKIGDILIKKLQGH